MSSPVSLYVNFQVAQPFGVGAMEHFVLYFSLWPHLHRECHDKSISNELRENLTILRGLEAMITKKDMLTIYVLFQI